MLDPAQSSILAGRAVPVSRLSLGTAALGNLYAPVTDEEATGVLRTALAAGVSYLDTAPHYGAGRAERRMGAALADIPRSAYVLSTKVGRLLHPLRAGEPPDRAGFADEPPYRRVWDFTAAGIRRSLEESLLRLGLDQVDVLYLHDPDEHEEEVYRTAYPALAALREQGMVRAIGAGMNQAEMLTRFVVRLDLDVVLLAGRYTLLEQGAAAFLDEAAARGIGVMLGGVFNSGILATGSAGGGAYNYRPPPPELLDRVRRIEAVCAAHSVALPCAALRFALAHPAVSSAVLGAISPDEVTRNLAALDTPIPAAFWAELRVAGLLDPTVPTP